MRVSLKPFKPQHAASILRRFSVDLQPSPPSPPPPDPISETLSLLRTTDPYSWPTDPSISTLLSSLPPPSILRITRQLPNYENAFQFFDYLKTTPDLSDSVPLAFQAVLEHAMRGNPEPSGKLYELFTLSKEQNVRLSVNAASLLIRCFRGAGMVGEMVMVFDAVRDELRNTDVLNLVIAGLFERDRVDDALKLLDEMLEPDACYRPNQNTVNIAFSSIVRSNQSGRRVTDERIYNLVLGFGKYGLYPDMFCLNQIISRLCRKGEYDKAWALLHEGMNSGPGVQVGSCNAVLTALGKKNDYARMNLLMKEMKEKGIKPNVVTYGIIIKQLCRFRRLDEALEVLEKMRDGEVGIAPDVVIYNTVINGLCKVGRQEEGLMLMERMRLDNECKPNTVTYNCLIDGFCKVGEIEKGQELFKQMGRDDVELNVVTLNTLLDGMCKNGRVSSAMEFFNRMREKGLKGDSFTYTSLITAFCNANNIDKAMKLLDEMHENGCSPDAVVYYSLISGLCQAGRMDDASFILSKLKDAGFSLDIVGYNIMISGFCKRKKLDKASEMLNDMEKDGLKPDRITYNTLLSHFCSTGDFTYAGRVMRKMIEEGFPPTVVTYGALIQGYCSNKNLDGAMRIYKDMKSLSSKVAPNTVIYSMLIDAHCKNDDVDGALALMDDMKKSGVRANTTTYNALFKGLQQRNLLEKVLDFMDQMIEQGCSPDYVTMEILTEWLPVVGETEKLRKFVRDFQVSDSTP